MELITKFKAKILIIFIILIFLFTFFFLYSNNRHSKEQYNNNKIEDIKKDDYTIDYILSDNGVPQIKLIIHAPKGVVKIIYPDGQIGEYNNKTELETFYSINDNGEYDFIIVFADGTEVTEKITVDFLTKINIDTDNNQNSDNNDDSTNDDSNSNPVNNDNANNNIDNKPNNNNNNNNQPTNDNNQPTHDDPEPVKEDRIVGKIYFNKPIGWTEAYLYVTKDGQSVSGAWPGINGSIVDNRIYVFNIMESMGDINNLSIEFNNGKYYKSASLPFPGFNKLFNFTMNAEGQFGSYEWIDYNSNTITVGGPVNNGNIKNVIFMIGDGMGVNHIRAAEIYNSYNLIFSNFSNTYVSTYSYNNFITDSAASATALATGKKTLNNYIGIDYYENEIETLAEYAHKKGMKTGLVVTQILNHATPAGFSAHSYNRSNYEEIDVDQINSGLDLMLGGGTNYFANDNIINLMNNNNYIYITNFNDIYDIALNDKVIGTFAPGSFHEASNSVPSLEEMTSIALNRLDSANGFFLMIEGSNIDTYSHGNYLLGMIIEVTEFDKAVRVAKNYVDSHPDTLLVVTADHETGGLMLNGANTSNSLLSNARFTSSSSSSKPHTASFVKVFAYGKTANGLTRPSLIDNTYIHNYIKQGLVNSYGY